MSILQKPCSVYVMINSSDNDFKEHTVHSENHLTITDNFVEGNCIYITPDYREYVFTIAY